LSQIREYRFSNRHGEVFEVLARCFAYEDDQQPLWDMSGSRTKLFDQIYSPDVRDKVANFFMRVVQSEYGGGETIKRGSDAEVDQFEKDYLRRQKEKPKE
jgi:hypothetical protein